MNPLLSPRTTATTSPNERPKRATASITSGRVDPLPISSTIGRLQMGAKKCVLRNRPGSSTAEAIWLDGSDVSREIRSAEVTRNVSVVAAFLGFLFLGGPAPPCLAACDANADGTITINEILAAVIDALDGCPQA